MSFTKGSINEFQNHIKGKIEKWGFSEEVLSDRLLFLVEEVGELIKSCRVVNHIPINSVSEKKYDLEEIGKELYDVLHFVFAIAIKLNINLEEEIFKKEAIVDQRIYQKK